MNGVGLNYHLGILFESEIVSDSLMRVADMWGDYGCHINIHVESVRIGDGLVVVGGVHGREMVGVSLDFFLKWFVLDLGLLVSVDLSFSWE